MENKIGQGTRPREEWSVCVRKKGKRRDEGDDGVGRWTMQRWMQRATTNQQRVGMVRQRQRQSQRMDEK